MIELKQIPTEQEMQLLIGTKKHSAWKGICAVIDSIYDTDYQWNVKLSLRGNKSKGMFFNVTEQFSCHSQAGGQVR